METPSFLEQESSDSLSNKAAQTVSKGAHNSSSSPYTQVEALKILWQFTIEQFFKESL